MGGPGSGPKKGTSKKNEPKKYVTSQTKYNKIRYSDKEAGRKTSRSTNRNMAKYVREKL